MDHTDPATYAFDGYLDTLGDNWLADDPMLRAWLSRSDLDAAAIDQVGQVGHAVATRYRELADESELRENLPYIAAKGPYNYNDQRVILPASTHKVLAEVHGSGIWKDDLDERVRYAIAFLLNQNGEAGVLCSVACTDGMARVLRARGNDFRSAEVVDRLQNASPTAWIHGAQFVTEIQGGSDAATNALQAESAQDGLYRLSGQKWFCSNLTADYWMVTARTPGGAAGHRGIGLFCVPRLWEGKPNGHTVDRLKDKLGTRALPTAEVDFTGALGWPVGPLDAGLKNMVAIVLTTSRIHNVLAAAAYVRRAHREAAAYAGFRQAFGSTLCEKPLIAQSLAGLARAADRMQAGAFATVDTWIDAMANPADQAAGLWARVLVSVSKAIATRTANRHIYDAMMILGGNGIEERFSPLPRLWRDSAIMETWEGPYALLLMQALGDMVRFGVAGKEREFLRRGLGPELGEQHVSELAAVLAAPAKPEQIRRWGRLAHELYASFEEQALLAFSD